MFDGQESPGPTACACRKALFLPERAIATDQRVGGTVVVELGLACTGQFGDDALRQRLAEFDTPLIEGIDAPDRALYEDAVFVQRHQLAKRGRRQLRQQDG